MLPGNGIVGSDVDHLPHILPHELNQRHISGPVIIEAVSRIAPPELLRTVQQHDTRPLRDKPVEGFAHLRISGVGIDDQCVQPPGQQMLKALLLRDDLRMVDAEQQKLVFVFERQRMRVAHLRDHVVQIRAHDRDDPLPRAALESARNVGSGALDGHPAALGIQLGQHLPDLIMAGFEFPAQFVFGRNPVSRLEMQRIDIFADRPFQRDEIKHFRYLPVHKKPMPETSAPPDMFPHSPLL